MKTTNLYLTLALILFMGTTASAQIMQRNYGGTFYLSGGYSNINLDDIQVLIPDAANDLTDHFANFGLGASFQIKGFIVGIHGEVLHSGTKVKDFFNKNDGDITTRSKGMKSMVSFGYAVIDMKKLRFYPMVGIGYSKLDLNVRSESDLTVAQITDGESVGNEYNVGVSNFMMDFALNFDYLFGKTNDEGVRKGFVKGMKVGYQYAIENDDWNHGGGDLIGAPDFGMSGFYAQITFGIGKFSQDKMCGRHKERLEE